MKKEIIIGREGNQNFKIVNDGVSSEHARLIVEDNGTMVLEDLGSRNGTYIRNASGDFDRISRIQVQEDDIIRLGSGGMHSISFWVHHLLVEDPTDYSYEFRHLIQLYNNEFKTKQDALWKKNDMRDWCAIGAPIAGLALSFLFNDNPLMIRMSITIPTLFVGLFFAGFMKKMRLLGQYRQRFIVCPHCGRPISDYDLEQQQCSFCKSHS